MKKLLFISLLVLLACEQQEVQTIRLDGSTGVKPLVEALSEAFMHYEPSYRIQVGEGMNTRKRIAALQSDSIDIAMASHGLDIEALEKQGFQVIRFAQMPVVLAVHSSVTVDDLSEEQICDIYAGNIRNWQEVGGEDLPVQPFSRPFDEVDAEVLLEHLACFSEITLDTTVQMKEKSGDLARALAGSPGGIGMTTLTRVNQSNGKMKAISINGVRPDASSIRENNYRLLRNSFLVTQQEPAPPVQAFLEFIKGRRGIQVLLNNDAIPVFED